MRSLVPTAGNMLIGTLNGTSIVSVLAVHDLLYAAMGHGEARAKPSAPCPSLQAAATAPRSPPSR